MLPRNKYTVILGVTSNLKGSVSDEYKDLTSVYEPKAFVCMRENLALALRLRESLPSLEVISGYSVLPPKSGMHESEID